jgi:hypothetical protein
MADLLTLRANAHSWDRSASTPDVKSLTAAFVSGLLFSLPGVAMTVLLLGKITEANTLLGRLRFGWTAVAAAFVGSLVRMIVTAFYVLPLLAENSSRF